MRLYHGSSSAIERPRVDLNTGFADLGRGFYLTDDPDVARARARSRARVDGAERGIVSAYEFREDAVSWATWGERLSTPEAGAKAGAPDRLSAFGLRFASDVPGLAAWATYIKSCRKGATAVPSLGEPAVVRAWIANDDVEMICSGFAPAAELAAFIDPADLVVQYCFRDQKTLDRTLAFAASEACD